MARLFKKREEEKAEMLRKRRRDYCRKIQKMKKETDQNILIMQELQEKEMSLLQSVQEYTQISQECEVKFNLFMNTKGNTTRAFQSNIKWDSRIKSRDATLQQL